ncbi:BA14K family protein [Mesorhizobium sp. B2-9-1]|uniref:BA14K family protein n=1 Tax=unclassified Mesorhizobium TaxID=325217 RepID=UPI00112C4D28|nr:MULTISPECIES: BA14K family protein [unclassified Mesorhizobium]TPI44050.1 BA14K family protein [Mesorhizobium sp. B2-9-1]TPJ22754.1 BA14K family protein [Mesorhizobium sp. B2-7-2]TPO02516.1 BA14K family protein [Mesorhizobium sp. B1-1-5]
MKALLGIVGGFVLTLAVFASGLAFATWLLAAKPVRQLTPAIGVSELWTKDAQPVDPQKQNLQRIPAQQAAVAPAPGGEPAKTDSAVQTATLAAPTAPAQPQQLQPTTAQPNQPAAEPDAIQPSQPAPADEQAQQQLPVAHLQWCSARYRSYRPAENSYRSYSGELRPCISPYYDPMGDPTASTGSNDRQGRDGQAVGNDRQTAAADDQTSDDQAEMEGYAPSGDGYATTYGGPPEEISPEAGAVRAQGRQISAAHVDDCFSRYRSYDPQDNTYQPFDGGPRRQCE